MKIRIYYCRSTAEQKESHILLAKAASFDTGERAELLDIATGEHGKPYFSQLPHVHFSITHSGGIWMCAFCSTEIGLDLQKHQSHRLKDISARFFHPIEDAFLQKSNYSLFFDMWAAKESYLKYTGQGISAGLNSFSVVGPEEEFPHMPGVCLKSLAWRDGWSLCLCIPAGNEPDVSFFNLDSEN